MDLKMLLVQTDKTFEKYLCQTLKAYFKPNTFSMQFFDRDDEMKECS